MALTIAKMEQEFLDITGYESINEYLESGEALDSIQLGICKECGYSTNVEPDQDKGWCSECDDGTVQSILVILGL